jgi:glycosyltransferase involved in cell wall biosynthesis
LKDKNEIRRILFAGYEIGGQMQLLAETFRKRWIQASSAAYNDDFRGYQNDIMMASQGIKGSVDRFLFFLWALKHYDIFHFFWGVSMLSWWRFHLIDLPFLRLFRKKIVVHFRGLDVIDINYFDYLRENHRGLSVEKPPINRADQRAKLKKWLRYADEVLVSEPDLFAVVPNSKLSPQVIDVDYWSTCRRPLSETDGIVRIVHAPSSRRKKGTDFIEKSIQELKARGHNIELVMAEKLSHHKIKELYEVSDIGIDQVLYGWHGKVSVELMSLQKPVVCYIDAELKGYRPDLPIVNASPADLTDVLENLIRNKSLREEIGIKSRDYVKRYHDVECVVDDLLDIYGLSQKNHRRDTAQDAVTW